MKSMAKSAAKRAEDLLWKIAESDEVEIETRRGPKAPAHRVTIWIVPTEDGVYVRSYKGKRGRWYQEAMANPLVTIHKYPGADHAFARFGGKTYSKPEADRALELSLAFFNRHLAGGAA